MVKSWVVYSIIRVALFFGVFAVLMVANTPFWLAAVIAAVFNLCFSYLFLRGRRDKLVSDLRARREAGADADSDETVEDESLNDETVEDQSLNDETLDDRR